MAALRSRPVLKPRLRVYQSVQAKCVRCASTFSVDTWHPHRVPKYCSPECRKPPPAHVRKCPMCLESFRYFPCEDRRAVEKGCGPRTYCSSRCYYKALKLALNDSQARVRSEHLRRIQPRRTRKGWLRRGVLRKALEHRVRVNCKHCHSVFYPIISHRVKYCSRRCYFHARRTSLATSLRECHLHCTYNFPRSKPNEKVALPNVLRQHHLISMRRRLAELGKGDGNTAGA